MNIGHLTWSLSRAIVYEWVNERLLIEKQIYRNDHYGSVRIKYSSFSQPAENE